jgi:hypothetical protein
LSGILNRLGYIEKYLFFQNVFETIKATKMTGWQKPSCLIVKRRCESDHDVLASDMLFVTHNEETDQTTGSQQHR